MFFMKKLKGYKKIMITFFVLLFILVLFFVFPGSCEKDFKIFSKKGYCEFNLKVCEGIFGCKEYEKVQVPCESVSSLCGEKILCDCGNVNN